MNSVRIQITGACVRADVCGGELDAQPRVENQEDLAQGGHRNCPQALHVYPKV